MQVLAAATEVPVPLVVAQVLELRVQVLELVLATPIAPERKRQESELMVQAATAVLVVHLAVQVKTARQLAVLVVKYESN